MTHATLLVIASLILCPYFAEDKNKTVVAVHHIGEMRKVMREGNLAASIDLSSLATKKHLYALGPLEGLRGEVTIWDSIPSISRIESNKVVTSDSYQNKACFLVYAFVAKWKEVPIPADVTNGEKLEKWLEKTASEQGINVNRPFPFLIKDAPRKLAFHIVNKTDDRPHTPASHEAVKVSFKLENTSIKLLGFYSDSHQGVFTHHDSNVHMHMITSDGKQSGHVESIQFSSKAVLLLPTE
ncbi:MAG: acetolactate decarboxylase [Planctomycetia bacterium]|jgi:acetolactate decarboxylase|nr:acetolactate decarboxylase [Planctomycetia bacterium]